MKKIFRLLIILLAFTVTSKVYALEGRITLECDSYNKKVGETISCTLYGNSDSGVSAVETKFEYNNLSLTNITVPSTWQGDYENKSLLLYTDTNKTGKFELLSFKVTSTVAGPKNFTFTDTYFTDASFTRNQLLNPDYTLTFVSDEEASNQEEQNEATIVDENTPTNNSQTENKEEIENPDEGAFLPLLLVLVLSIISVVVYFKTKGKKIFKL